jgi:hypothetical protein
MTSSSTALAPQFMRALQVANRVRVARAELKAHIATGELRAAEVVLSCPTEAQSMQITDLLLAQKRWGPARCQRFLVSVPLRENKTLGSMTERQRHAVADKLSPPGARH